MGPVSSVFGSIRSFRLTVTPLSQIQGWNFGTASFEYPTTCRLLLMLVAVAAMSPFNIGRNWNPVCRVHINAGVKFPSGSFGAPAKPTTSPRSLIIMGVFQYPAWLGFLSSTGTPLSHSTACLAVTLPTATPHSPDMPTTCPRLFKAVAAPDVSPASGASARISLRPGPHTTGRNCSSCGLIHVGSLTAVSAQPAVSPRSFVPVAKLLVPLKVRNARIFPDSGFQTKP